MGVRAFRKLLPNIPHVVVFDTSFHQTMPKVLICIVYHITITKILVFVNTVSMVQAINMYHVVRLIF